ncbi:MAG: hypothetical protein EBU34_14190 [Alphaproteobacteria bacterium]|nr:hypothetical protein [Alphaproteobacteria bacterium]
MERNVTEIEMGIGFARMIGDNGADGNRQLADAAAAAGIERFRGYALPGGTFTVEPDKHALFYGHVTRSEMEVAMQRLNMAKQLLL